MNLAVIADPDLRERMRCIRVIADQTPVSALGAATWHELDQVLEVAPGVGLILYAHPLAGAPEDAIQQLLTRTKHLVLAVADDQELPATEGFTRATRPIAEETLVVVARALSALPSSPHVSFAPVDFLQMICMSGGSHVIVLSQDSGDAGVIEVRGGEVWTAFDALGVGEAAFARLIRPEMRARVGPTTGSTKERTLFKGLQQLVLDSIRCMDEGKVSLAPPLSPTQLAAAFSSPQELSNRIHQLHSDARRLLMARNYEEAAQTLLCLSELEPTSHLVRANLEQLRRLGFPQ